MGDLDDPVESPPELDQVPRRNSHNGEITLSHRVSHLIQFGLRPLDAVARRLRLASKLLLFEPRPDDIYLVSYPRSGTTWLQMILYQLTSDGGMGLAHISEVIPFFEHSIDIARNLNNLPSPRIFKTHCRYRQLRKFPGRYIYIVRNGRDVLLSYFHFHNTHFGFRSTFDDFFQAFVQGKVAYGSWFQHVAEWHAHSVEPNVLLLRYEDLIENLAKWLLIIAEFCHVQIPPENYPRIMERCTFSFMKEHESKFDHINELLWERGFITGNFIRQGRVGAWAEYFTNEQDEAFERLLQSAKGLEWQTRTGCSRSKALSASR